jgi:hypothetical protein
MMEESAPFLVCRRVRGEIRRDIEVYAAGSLPNESAPKVLSQLVSLNSAWPVMEKLK